MSAAAAQQQQQPEQKKATCPITVVDGLLFAFQGISTYTLLSAVINSKMNNSYFAGHPKAAICGVSAVITGGYLMASKSKRKAMTYSKRLLAHQISMAIGTGSIYYALWIIYNNKNMNNRKHLQSYHSYLGAAAGVALAGLNIGTAALEYGNATNATKSKGYKLHRMIATASLATLTGAVITGTISTFKPDSNTTLKVSSGIVASLGVVIASAMGLLQ